MCTVKELKYELKILGIFYASNAKKPELVTLFPAGHRYRYCMHKVVELKVILKNVGLSTQGKKVILIDRIISQLNSQNPSRPMYTGYTRTEPVSRQSDEDYFLEFVRDLGLSGK